MIPLRLRQSQRYLGCVSDHLRFQRICFGRKMVYQMLLFRTWIKKKIHTQPAKPYKPIVKVCLPDQQEAGTWELVRNAKVQAHLRLAGSETPG